MYNFTIKHALTQCFKRINSEEDPVVEKEPQSLCGLCFTCVCIYVYVYVCICTHTHRYYGKTLSFAPGEPKEVIKYLKIL